ncbi:MAG: hypothetical protein LLF76_04340 [Planctomycetaceae bacterium]|nr:hypothetical protein [Planctomycetaceae bacterium]
MYVLLLSAHLMLAAEINAQQAIQTADPTCIQVDVKRKPADAEWRSYKTRTLDTVRGFEPNSKVIGLDKYGGRTDRKTESTGFFYPRQIDGRWWLVDPEGHLFIHMAISSVNTGRTDTTKKVFLDRFGSEENWANFSTDLLDQYGFNGSGGWSQVDVLRKAKHPPVYTVSLSFMQDFARGKRLAWSGTGHHQYPNEVWPVFHPDFERFCNAYARKMIGAKDDPYCIGYFSDNELQMNVDMLDRTLRLDLTAYPGMKHNFDEAKRWLSERKGKPAGLEDVNDQDRVDFIGHMFDRYFSLTTGAIRKYDPNHLCLGPRLHSDTIGVPIVFRTAGKYVDVLSINYYYRWDPDPEEMAMWTRETGKPFLITEWYAKAEDSGLENASGAGWLVKTQADRAKFYHNFTLGLMESRNCVGWHWFKYQDNNPNDLTTDPSNRNSNKGVVTYDYRPYTTLLDGMKHLNDHVYSLTDYFDSK